MTKNILPGRPEFIYILYPLGFVAKKVSMLAAQPEAIHTSLVEKSGIAIKIL